MYDCSLDGLNNSSSMQALNDVKEKLKLEKKEKQNSKKLIKDMAACKTMLEEMEVSRNSSLKNSFY